jgi:phosphatidylinositol glycan class K
LLGNYKLNLWCKGHGGNGFLKFQDFEEIANVELADAFEQMWQKRRYHELFFMIDTCQAVSMYEKFYSPNILAIASSQIGQDSLSHNPDQEIGVYMIDRFTYYTLRFFEKVTPASKATVGQLFRSYDPSLVMSKPGYRTDLFKRNIDKVLITDFFGSVRNVQLMQSLPVAVTTRSSLPNQTGDFSGSDISNLTWSSSDFQSDGEQGLPQWADSVQFTMALVVFLTAVFLAVIWR